MPLLPMRSHAKAVALFYPVREYVRLTSSKDVEDLHCAAKLNRKVVSEIQELEVFIHDTTGIKPIRAILPLAQNIRALVLEFPFKPIQLFPTFTIFNHLVSLSVNIPHAIIGPFLQRHPHLETLELGACTDANTQICPLTHYFLRFPRLAELICPLSCVRALTTGSAVNKLEATYDGVIHQYFPILRLLDFRQIETSASLTSLLIDFDSTTPQLLHRISVAAPALRVLKLTESVFSDDNISQMPWDGPDWIIGLQTLHSLVELELRTWHPLRETPMAENSLIISWVRSAPPSLRRVVVVSGIHGESKIVLEGLDEEAHHVAARFGVDVFDPSFDSGLGGQA